MGTTPIEIKLENGEGEVLVSEHAKGQGVFMKKYIMTSLPDGIYYLKLMKNGIQTVQPVEVLTGRVQIVEAPKNAKFEPVFYERGDHKLDINALMPGYEKVEIRIMDKSNHVVFETSLSDVFTLHERVDVSELSRGSYTLVVKTVDDSYAYNFNR